MLKIIVSAFKGMGLVLLFAIGWFLLALLMVFIFAGCVGLLINVGALDPSVAQTWKSPVVNLSGLLSLGALMGIICLDD